MCLEFLETFQRLGQGVDCFGRSCTFVSTFLHDELEFFNSRFTVHLDLTVEEVQNLVCILGYTNVVCNTREVAVGVLHGFLGFRLNGVFLNASSRIALLVGEALRHASINAYSNEPANRWRSSSQRNCWSCGLMGS